jgi:2',3'-cyclic-nucleotide 2'-phosphodiesterase (5'-nucleotidase family)
VGGVARRAAIINNHRSKGENVLLLDGGDSLTGDADPAKKTGGQTSVEAMNRMGYDAMALGSGDMALGLTTLRQRMSEAKFAILSANAVVSPTGEAIAPAYVIREIGGHRVAIVGLSDGPSTAEIAVRDPLPAARQTVAALKGQADEIFLVSHVGLAENHQIAESVPGIAVIVSGGDQVLIDVWQSHVTGTFVYDADHGSLGHAGRYLGAAQLSFDATGKLTAHAWQRLSLSPEVTDDPTMAAWADEVVNQ